MSSGLELPLTDVAIRLSVAAVLGAVIGLERERLERAAGLRTHAIVAVSAALLSSSPPSALPTPSDRIRTLCSIPAVWPRRS